MIAYQMKTKDEHFINRHKAERGNALIYVLIAIALFAALSFTLSRQTNTDEAGNLDDERAKFYATQLISYAGQANSVIDQMLFTGSDIADLNFLLPGEVGFNTAPHIHKVYHPEGGGLNKTNINDGAVTQNITDPPAGWYLGMFNNIDWTDSTDDDVILVAYQLKRSVCEQINKIINGSIAIPTMQSSIRETMIDDALYLGTNEELTTATVADICFECNNVQSLCVENQAQTAYGFYSILAARQSLCVAVDDRAQFINAVTLYRAGVRNIGICCGVFFDSRGDA